MPETRDHKSESPDSRHQLSGHTSGKIRRGLEARTRPYVRDGPRAADSHGRELRRGGQTPRLHNRASHDRQQHAEHSRTGVVRNFEPRKGRRRKQMGSVTSTTRAIASLFGGEEDIATRLRRVFTPCPRGDGLKTINVRIFDEHVLVTEMATSQEIVNGLQAFLDGMHSSPGLEPAVTASLSALNFQVTYTAADPTKNVINNFRHRDFPIYLL